MKKFDSSSLVALIFCIVGVLFASMAVVFMAVSSSFSDLVASGRAYGDAEALPILGAVFGGVGLILILVAAVLIVSRRRHSRRLEELRTWGTRVTGTVTDIPVDTTLTVNGRHPLRVLVEVTHPVTGQIITVRSPQVWETSLSSGDPVDVLFDPMDEKQYVIDM